MGAQLDLDDVTAGHPIAALQADPKRDDTPAVVFHVERGVGPL
jgi:hypothetical protein